MFLPKHSRKFFPSQMGLIGLVAVVFFFYNNCSQGLKVVAGSGSSATVVSHSATNTVGQPFPRLGSYFIGGQPGSSYTLAWANYLALFNVNIIGGYTGTGAGMYGGSRKSFVAEVLALTPANVGSQVFQYYIVDSGDPSSQSFDGLQYGLWNLTAANPNWWAWTNGLTQTTHVYNTYFNPTWYQTNETLAAGKNSAGLYFEEAAAQNQYQTFWQSTAPDAAPNLAGLFHDNFSTQFQVDFDYNLSGTTTSYTDSNFILSFEQGMATGPNWIHKNTNILVLGNVADWSSPGRNLPLSQYNQILNGGVFEGAFGETWSTMTWGGGGTTPSAAGFADFQAQYASIMSKMLAPAYVILGHDNLTANGTDPYQSKSYAALRFGLTATIVNGDGFYYPNLSYDVGTGNWYDEFAVDTSGNCLSFDGTAASVAAGRGYLGYPTSSFGSISGTGLAVNYNGLWVRLFYNPTTNKTWAVINSPPGSGSLTLNASSLGRSSFKMLNGKQDAVTNNGSSVSSVTISAGYDGLIVQLL